MFSYRNGRKKFTEPGNNVVGFSRRTERSAPVVVSAKRVQWVRALGWFSYIYAWFVHLVCIPMLYCLCLFGVASEEIVIFLAWCAFAGLPIVFLVRLATKALVPDDDARSYEAIKIYLVGMLLLFAFTLLYGIAGEIWEAFIPVS